MGQNSEVTGGRMIAMLEELNENLLTSRKEGAYVYRQELSLRHLPMCVVLAAADVRCDADATIKFERQAAGVLGLVESDVVAQHWRLVSALGPEKVGGITESLKLGPVAREVLHRSPPEHYGDVTLVVGLAHEQELSLQALAGVMLPYIHETQPVKP